jgi:hypothetical protein
LKSQKAIKSKNPKKSENGGVVENEEESGANNTIEGEVEKGEPLIDKDSIFRKSNRQTDK